MDFLNEAGAVIAETKDASEPESKFHDWLYETLSNPEYKLRWDGLCQIFERSYWTRLWVIQGLVVTPHPEEVRLLCGSSHGWFIHFRIIVRQLRQFHRNIAAFSSEGSVDSTINEIMVLAERVADIAKHVEAWESTNQDEIEFEIPALLHLYRNRICADPR
jgi:hypothetical protein